MQTKLAEFEAALAKMDAALGKSAKEEERAYAALEAAVPQGSGLQLWLQRGPVPNCSAVLASHGALWGPSLEARASRTALQQKFCEGGAAPSGQSPLLFSGGTGGGVRVCIAPASSGGRRLIPHLFRLDAAPCLDMEIFRRLKEEALRDPSTWRKGLSQEVLGEMNETSRRAFAGFCTKAWLDMDGTLRDVFLSKTSSSGFYSDGSGGMHADAGLSRNFAGIFADWLKSDAPERIGKTEMSRKAAMALWSRLVPEDRSPAPGR